eukprot:gene15905-17505_t
MTLGRHSQSTPETPLISSSPEDNHNYTMQAVAPKKKTFSVSSNEAAESDVFPPPQQQQRDRNFSRSSTIGGSGRFSRPKSPGSPPGAVPDIEVQFQGGYQQEQPWVKDARKQSSREPIINPDAETVFGLFTVCFDKSWSSGLWQSSLAVLIFLCLPSVLFAIVGLCFLYCAIIPQLGRSVSEKRKLRLYMATFVVAILLSLVKDSIIAMTIVSVQLNVTVTIYVLCYAFILLLSILIFVAIPIFVFLFSDARFSYGDEGREASKKSPSNKLANDFLKENLHGLHDVRNTKSVFRHFTSRVPTYAFVIVILVVVVLCIFRNFIPWILIKAHQDNQQPTTSIFNTTNQPINNTMASNTTIPIAVGNTSEVVKDVILGLSSLNAFMMSLTISFVFAVALIWQMMMANAWKEFSDSLQQKSQLISAGCDGIIAWWRVYQTLKFLTWSAGSPVGYLRLFIETYFQIAVAVLSIAMFSSGPITSHAQKTDICLMVVDCLLLISGLLIVWAVSFVISSRQNSLPSQLSLIRLNMTEELGKYSINQGNEAERTEGEYQAHLKKFKGRNLKASVFILQDLVPVIKDLESSSVYFVKVLFAVIIFVIGIVSSGLSIKKLMRLSFAY